jgi:hypothetical protein
LLRNFVARLAFRDSRYEIFVCETHEKRVSQLILTRESRENLARILDLKSESRFLREFQKVILVSTLPITLSTPVNSRWAEPLNRFLDPYIYTYIGKTGRKSIALGKYVALYIFFYSSLNYT